MFGEEIADTACVLRLKGETKGHSFYSYMEECHMLDRDYTVCEKFKYATVFDTKEEAETFKRDYDIRDIFDIVAFKQAEEEYYH